MPSQPEAGVTTEIRCVVTTFSKESDATGTIRTLLAENLIACGTLLHGARSIYLWKGEIEDCEEIVVIFKTAAATVEKASARLKELHPYEVPEILVFTPEAANSAYAKWVDDTCASH